MTKRLLVLIWLLLAIGCGPDPEKEARAHAIRRESEALYLATATSVAIGQDLAEIRAKATATAIADKEQIRAATQNDRIARKENVIWWSTVAAVIMVLAAGCSISIASVGGAVALYRRLRLQAMLVRLDRETRTWPVMLDIKTGLLVDLETGERARLDTVNQIDHRRLIISGQARTTGILAQAATDVAKATKDAKPADMLAAIGQSVPLLKGE